MRGLKSQELREKAVGSMERHALSESFDSRSSRKLLSRSAQDDTA